MFDWCTLICWCKYLFLHCIEDSNKDRYSTYILYKELCPFLNIKLPIKPKTMLIIKYTCKCIQYKNSCYLNCIFHGNTHRRFYPTACHQSVKERTHTQGMLSHSVTNLSQTYTCTGPSRLCDVSVTIRVCYSTAQSHICPSLQIEHNMYPKQSSHPGTLTLPPLIK